MRSKQDNGITAGVDVSSTELVVRISCDQEVRRYENSPRGVREFLRLCVKECVAFVVCEHTGRHEWMLLKALWERGIPVHCAHPRAVNNFAKALKANAKSDPIDAGVLMEYGVRMELAPTPPPPPELELLREFTARREDLNEMLVKEKNRLTAPGVSEPIKRSIRSHIRQLSSALKGCERQIEKLVAQYPSLRSPIERLDEEHGVGILTAATLYASMPELGTLNRQTAASLAGLAPFVRSSGKFVGQRKIGGGRTQARTALYMVALTVVRKHDHPLRALYLRLKKAGKRSLVALTAVMRKLIIRFNTILAELRIQKPAAELGA